jgi:WD40 repeat protein
VSYNHETYCVNSLGQSEHICLWDQGEEYPDWGYEDIADGGAKVQNNSYCRWLNAHSQEVCGVTFNENEMTLASGGNDNKVLLIFYN